MVVGRWDVVDALTISKIDVGAKEDIAEDPFLSVETLGISRCLPISRSIPIFVQ